MKPCGMKSGSCILLLAKSSEANHRTLEACAKEDEWRE